MCLADESVVLVVVQEVRESLLQQSQKIFVRRPYVFGHVAQRVVFLENWLMK